MDLGLAGRVVLVTGGGSGIGLATVEGLLGEGAMVATCSRSPMSAALSSLGADGAHLLFQQADVGVNEQMADLVEATVARFGRLDALVNNAGRGIHGRLDDLSTADWQNELGTKVFGVLTPTRAAIPHLARSDSARIVNISAVSAHEPDPAMIAVSAARAAVSNLSRSLAFELAGLGINVNTLSVGIAATGRLEAAWRRVGSELPLDDWAVAEAHRRGVLLGRPAEAGEIASAILFLCSSRASYITGATLDVAGGMNRNW